MPTPVVISRAPANPGIDYAALRADALQFIQEAAGEIWTDYNEHDPGVTTLEQLCYALTELSYRTAFPAEDLLCGPHGAIDTRRQALHVPRRILPGAPVTANDYRKLLVDRIAGLGNAWLMPANAPDAVNGLYDVLLYVPGTDHCVCEGAPPDPVLAQALGVYARSRGLCEDVRRITLLRPARTLITATAVIDSRAAPDAALADLLYRAGRFLAPEVRRRRLADLTAEGLPPSRIFEGPLLRNGFIDDSELEPKADTIDCVRLVEAMASASGVLSVNDVTVRVGRQSYGPTDLIPVPPNEILQLDPCLDGKAVHVRIIRQGSFCRPDPARVRQELTRLWRGHRRLHPLSRDYLHAYAMPRGKQHDLAHYDTVAAQYPETYGIGPRGLGSNVPALRQAQAKQLKGYLLVFEQLLADYLAQLAHARDLLSTDATLDRSYFGTPLAEAIPDIGELLIAPDAIDDLRRERDPWAERRNRFLDLLLALYAEELPPDLPGGCNGETSDEDAEQTLIKAKLGLLNRIAVATRTRGLGFDYLAAASPRNAAGLEIKSRLKLDIPDSAGAAADGEPRKLILVEHVLLRSARRLRGAGIGLDTFDYAFTVSAVLCLPDAPAGGGESGWGPGLRRQAADLLRANTPAHVVVQPRFVDADTMRAFESLYAAWCTAMRERTPREIARASVAIRDFLVLHPVEGEPAPAPPGGDDPS